MRVSSLFALLAAVSLGLCCVAGSASAEVLKLRYQFETTIEPAPKPMVTEPMGDGSAREFVRLGKAKIDGLEQPVSFGMAQMKMGDSATSEKVIAPEVKKEESTVTLGDGHFYVEGATTAALYDFKRKRVSNFDLAAKTFDEHSLFVYCGFKDLEIRNRAMLSEVLEKVGMGDTTSSVFDPFDVACELGMIMPDKEDNPGIEMSVGQNGELLSFSYKGKIVAEAVLGDKIDDAYVPMMEKFLIYKASLHPFVREQIIAKKRVVKFFSYHFRAAMRKYSVKILLMDKTKSRSEPTYFDGYRLTFDKVSPLYAVQQRIMLDDKPIVLPTRDEAFGEAQKLVNQHKLTDAFLAVSEYNLTTGDRAEEDSGDIISEVKDDPTFKTISTCLEPANKKEAEKALENLQGIKTDGLEKGYMLEIFKANIADSLGLDASKMFLSAITKNPHLTGVYNDLGKHFYSRYDSLGAWNSWDLARKVCPTYPMLDSVVKLESRLQRLHPEYF